MASKTNSTLALILALNILCFSMVSGSCRSGCPTPNPNPKPTYVSAGQNTNPKPTPTPTPSPNYAPTPSPNRAPPPPTSSPNGAPTTTDPSPNTALIGSPNPTPSPANPNPTPSPSPSSGKCPVDVLKFRACGDLFYVGNKGPSIILCCGLISGLDDFDAAVCLCSAIKADIFDVNRNTPGSLNLLLNTCGRSAPSGFQCS